MTAELETKLTAEARKEKAYNELMDLLQNKNKHLLASQLREKALLEAMGWLRRYYPVLCEKSGLDKVLSQPTDTAEADTLLARVKELEEAEFKSRMLAKTYKDALDEIQTIQIKTGETLDKTGAVQAELGEFITKIGDQLTEVTDNLQISRENEQATHDANKRMAKQLFETEAKLDALRKQEPVAWMDCYENIISAAEKKERIEGNRSNKAKAFAATYDRPLYTQAPPADASKGDAA